MPDEVAHDGIKGLGKILYQALCHNTDKPLPRYPSPTRLDCNNLNAEGVDNINILLIQVELRGRTSRRLQVLGTLKRRFGGHGRTTALPSPRTNTRTYTVLLSRRETYDMSALVVAITFLSFLNKIKRFIRPKMTYEIEI